MDIKTILTIVLTALAVLAFVHRSIILGWFSKSITQNEAEDISVQNPSKPERPVRLLKTNCRRVFKEIKDQHFALAAECNAPNGGRECQIIFCGNTEEIELEVEEVLDRAHWLGSVSPDSQYHRTACKPHFLQLIAELRERRQNAENTGAMIALNDDDRTAIEFFRAVFYEDFKFFTDNISAAIGASLNRNATTTELFHAFLAKPNERLTQVRGRTTRRRTTMSIQAVKENRQGEATSKPSTSPSVQTKPARTQTMAMESVPLTGISGKPVLMNLVPHNKRQEH